MSKYCIVAASPKNASSHIKTKFKTYYLDIKKNEWVGVGWKSLVDICELIEGGNEVVTAKVKGEEIYEGSSVEVELRIAKNKSEYKISEMPTE